MSDKAPAVGPRQLAGVFWRSFFLQASWSFERMQSLGFAFALLPALRACYPDKTVRAERVRQEADYFNTHPYLASFILGAAARKELERARNEDPAADPAGIKAALAAPLGALGDSLFWGGLRPLAALLAVAFLSAGLWWSPVLLLVFYNVWHVGARFDLLLLGFASGGDASALMRRFNFPRMAQFSKALTLGTAGCIVGLAPVWATRHAMVEQLPKFLLAPGALLLTYLLAEALRRGGSPIKLMLTLAAVSLILSYTGALS